ncbi:MAG: hypothetical protein ACFFAO_06545, partial [Candidatus Hermodarchaeota archaeon]
MKSRTIKNNRLIIKKFVESGINVTPSILEFISNFDDPIGKVDDIIKESSFLPTFNGHLTIEFLKKLSDKEIQKALKRHNLNELRNSQSKNSIDLQDNFDDLSKVPDSKGTTTEDMKSVNSINKNAKVNSIIETKPVVLKNKNVLRDSKKKLEKKSYKIKPVESIKSNTQFNPVAKNYDFSYEIVKDPTGKLYTNGDYSDFYELTVDKYAKLRALMKKRSDTFSASNIINVLRNSQKQEIAIIGLVKEIRQTKNNNYFLT